MLMVVVVVVIRQQQNESNRISLRTMMVRLVVVRRMINFVGRNDLLPEIGPNDSIFIHDTGYIYN